MLRRQDDLGRAAAPAPRDRRLTIDGSPQATWSVDLASPDETARFAGELADLLRPGDLVTLSGELGAGKTTLARAIVRHLTGDPDLEVPSPTFTLMQVYPTRTFPIVHADLYRIRNPDELAELGWDEASEGALVLVEWADRIGPPPPHRLDVALSLPADNAETARHVLVTGYGSVANRIAAAQSIMSLLAEAGFDKAERRFLTGDASTRAYERLLEPDGRRAILMISPPRGDAPVVRYGKPYYEIARLAYDIRPYLAMTRALRAHGVSAPEVLAADPDAGLAVIEDLGEEPFVDAAGPLPDRYLEAVGLLAQLHAASLPRIVPQGEGIYAIPPYDLDALLIEAELVIDWYAPAVAKVAVPASGRAAFLSACTRLFEEVLAQEATWCLRDFHSPNLIWLGTRQGTGRVGLIDFQDTVIGHPAYDLVSLLQDARVSVPDALEIRLLGAYAQLRRVADPGFDMATFVRAYAIMGVQRATKILGIFARLDKRDRKPQYLAMLPRIEAYLRKGLAHPALAELKGWYEAYLPRAFGDVPTT